MTGPAGNTPAKVTGKMNLRHGYPSGINAGVMKEESANSPERKGVAVDVTA